MTIHIFMELCTLNITNSPNHSNMKFTLSCVLMCMHICLPHNIKSNKKSIRIAGGRNATDDEFPYVVRLITQSLATQNDKLICSAVVLTSKWTLTAGHCVTNIRETMLSTNIVQYKLVIEYRPTPKSDVANSEVIDMISHPNLNRNNQGVLDNDIALLHTQPVLFAKYGKLSPVDYATLYGQEVSIVGYGVIEPNKPVVPFPQVLDVMVQQCRMSLIYPQMCFVPSCSKHSQITQAACSGDSGGPAIHASGVVSINAISDLRNCGIYLGVRFGRVRYDTGYYIAAATPVSPYIDWISSVMKTEI